MGSDAESEAKLAAPKLFGRKSRGGTPRAAEPAPVAEPVDESAAEDAEEQAAEDVAGRGAEPAVVEPVAEEAAGRVAERAAGQDTDAPILDEPVESAQLGRVRPVADVPGGDRRHDFVGALPLSACCTVSSMSRIFGNRSAASSCLTVSAATSATRASRSALGQSE